MLNTVLKACRRNGKVLFPIYFEQECMKLPVTELELPPRVRRALKYMECETVLDVVNLLSNKADLKLKGVGIKSMAELQYQLCHFQYVHIPEKEKRMKYLRRIVELNCPGGAVNVLV